MAETRSPKQLGWQKEIRILRAAEIISEEDGEAKFVMTQPSVKRQEAPPSMPVPASTPREELSPEEEVIKLMKSYEKGAF